LLRCNDGHLRPPSFQCLTEGTCQANQKRVCEAFDSCTMCNPGSCGGVNVPSGGRERGRRLQNALQEQVGDGRDLDCIWIGETNKCEARDDAQCTALTTAEECDDTALNCLFTFVDFHDHSDIIQDDEEVVPVDEMKFPLGMVSAAVAAFAFMIAAIWYACRSRKGKASARGSVAVERSFTSRDLRGKARRLSDMINTSAAKKLMKKSVSAADGGTSEGKGRDSFEFSDERFARAGMTHSFEDDVDDDETKDTDGMLETKDTGGMLAGGQGGGNFSRRYSSENAASPRNPGNAGVVPGDAASRRRYSSEIASSLPVAASMLPAAASIDSPQARRYDSEEL